MLSAMRALPLRTSVATHASTAVAVVLVAGAGDRIFVFFGVPYPTLLWVFRGAFVVAPVAAYFVTRKLCRESSAARRAEA